MSNENYVVYTIVHEQKEESTFTHRQDTRLPASFPGQPG